MFLLYGTIQRVSHDSSEGKMILNTLQNERLKVTLIYCGRTYEGAHALAQIFFLFFINLSKLIVRIYELLSIRKVVGN